MRELAQCLLSLLMWTFMTEVVKMLVNVIVYDSKLSDEIIKRVIK